jgi:HEAT repeat protein
MAKARGIDAKLNRLRALRDQPVSPELDAALRAALGDASNLVAAEAAQIIGVRLLAELAPELVVSFDRFMLEPEETDKLCRAKNAIVETLNKIEYEKEDVFLRGIHHVQMEPAWGEPYDAAAQLRGNSAFALVRINYRGVLNLLVDLLGDKEIVARLAAVQALGQTGSVAAIPLLRFKARTGDKDPAVAAECLTALVQMAPGESLPFVTEFLHARTIAIREGAAFALAEARSPEALHILRTFLPEAQRGGLHEAVLLAISMLRLPAALDFLLEVIAGENKPAALAALSALAIHRHNENLRERIAAAVASKADASLKSRFDQKFAV